MEGTKAAAAQLEEKMTESFLLCVLASVLVEFFALYFLVLWYQLLNLPLSPSILIQSFPLLDDIALCLSFPFHCYHHLLQPRKRV